MESSLRTFILHSGDFSVETVEGPPYINVLGSSVDGTDIPRSGMDLLVVAPDTLSGAIEILGRKTVHEFDLPIIVLAPADISTQDREKLFHSGASEILPLENIDAASLRWAAENAIARQGTYSTTSQDRIAATPATQDSTKEQKMPLSVFRELFGTLTHDLLTPVTPIRTGLDILANSKDEQAIEKMTAIMLKEIKKLTSIIVNLQTIVNLPQRKVDLSWAEHFSATEKGTVELIKGKDKKTSEIQVTLPLLTEPDQSEGESPRSETSGPSSCRVLVVDDSPSVSKMISIAMRQAGHEVATALDGQDAVEKAEKFLPHVVIMDIGMPILNGYEAAEKIRAEDWSDGMILIALTGWNEFNDLDKIRDAGFDHYVSKPPEVGTLKELVKESYEQSQD